MKEFTTLKNVKTTEYILSEEEMKQVKYCVNYCWHRKTKHGSKQFDADKLDQLRIALGIVKETDILGDHCFTEMDKIVNKFFNN